MEPVSQESNNESQPEAVPGERTSGGSRFSFPVVGIGASAGGVSALEAFFEHLPEKPGMAFIVILHLEPNRKSALSEILRRRTSMPVLEIADRVDVEPDHVYVLPPNHNVELQDGALVLVPLEVEREQRAQVDHLFRSLADSAGEQAVCVILSGTGSNGSLGLKRVKERNGVALVQVPEDAAYDDMPRHAISTGLIDVVAPVRELGGRLVQLRGASSRPGIPDGKSALSDGDADALHKIFAQLRARTGHDFGQYKRSTILRRIARRMQVNDVDAMPAYLNLLRVYPAEVHALFKDLLISVTNFFRDPGAFNALETEVIPNLFRGRGADDSIRVWVAGCATGEEAYSLAMLLCEHATRLEGRAPHIQIFATDIDEDAIAVAREGLYPQSIEEDVSDRRLRRFFTHEAGGYRVKQEVRELVLFALHNILKDPPFSRLDLVTCRNLLIYINRDIQDKVFEVLHYALTPGGYLFLGSAESAEGMPDQFAVVDKKHRIYRRLALSATAPHLPVLPVTGPTLTRTAATRDVAPGERQGFESLHRKLLEETAPPSIILNENHEVAHLTESAGRYLRFAGGEPTRNVFKLIRKELRLELRASLFQAVRRAETVRSKQIPVTLEGEERLVGLTVRPITDPEYPLGMAQVLFHETIPEAEQGESSEVRPAAADSISQHLEEEVQHLRRQLQATIEENETSAEELKASNEELQSMNEELRSTAEELETSKEELQSINEELDTVNQELKRKNADLTLANSDLQNLIVSTDIATVFLDRDLRIKRFTPRVKDLFNVIGSDVGRPLEHLTHRMGYEELHQDAAQVLERLTPIEREVKSTDEHWYLVRLLPYRTVEDRIDGVVITFVGITRMKGAEEVMRELNVTLEERIEARTAQVRALASALTLAEQRERRRVAQLLHDELQQVLFGAQMKLQMLRMDIENGEWDELRHQAEQVEQILDRAIKSTRTLTMEMSPPLLKGENLLEGLKWLAVQMEEMHGLQVHLDPNARVRVENEDMQAFLLRIVRELLFNVVKHANVKEARVTVAEGEGELVLSVEDEGSGFDPAVVEQEGRSGFGLFSVRERVALFGGRLDMKSSVRAGTRVTVVIPLGDQTS